MPETLALVRMSLSRSRFLLWGMLSAIAISVSIALMASPLDPGGSTAGGIAITALFLTLMPAGMASITLFDYSSGNDMSHPGSGCSHWLLRMPVRSWKIAMVPVTLKTLWITGLWLVFVFTIRAMGTKEEISIVGPIFTFSATAVWVLVLTWRPFRCGWHRIVAISVSIPIFYLCLTAVLIAPGIRIAEWRPAAIVGTIVGAIVLYLASVLLAIRSVELARTSIAGIIPELGSEDKASWFSAEDDRVRQFESPGRALIAHDRLQSQLWIRRTCMLGVIPATVLFIFLPLAVPTVVLALFSFAYLAGIAVCRTAASADNPYTLPPYLAASPLSSATIAWTRFAGPMLIATSIFFCVLLVFVGWALWAENRDTWFHWASERASDIGSADAVTVGLRWSLVIVIGSAIFFLGRIASYFWIGMAGRTWVGFAASIAGGLVYLVPLGVLLRWFMQQTDWETTQASAISYLALAPYLIGGLLALKGLSVTAALIAIFRRRSAPVGKILGVVTIWASITLAISALLTVLIPDSRVTFPWSLAMVSLAIPLTRVLVLPLVLAWNRHR